MALHMFVFIAPADVKTDAKLLVLAAKVVTSGI